MKGYMSLFYRLHALSILSIQTKTFAYCHKWVILIVLGIGMQPLTAQTSWTGVTSSNWSTSTNWTNGVPTDNTDAIIGDDFFTGTYQPSLTRVSSCRSLMIGNGAKASTLTSSKSLTVTNTIYIAANGTITHSASKISILGNWINEGIYNATSTTATVVFAGATQVIQGTSTFKKLTINAGSTTTLMASITVANTFTVNGIFDPTSPAYSVTLTGASFIVGAGATIKVNAANFNNNYSIAPTTLNRESIVDYASSTINQTIAVLTYGTLKISGGSTKTLAANITPSASLATSGNVNITAGTLDLTTFTINRAAGGGGSFTVGKDASLKIGASNTFPTNYATIKLDPFSTVEYCGTTQLVLQQAYGNLIFSNTDVKTFAPGVTTIAGDFIIRGTATGNTTTNRATIHYNGTRSQDTPPLTYHDLLINNTVGTSLSSDATITNTLTFVNGNLITNSNKVVLGPNATLAGEENGKYIIGTVSTTRNVATASNTFGGMGVVIASGVDDLGSVTITRKSGNEATMIHGGKSGINRSWAIDITGDQPVHGRTVTFSWIPDDDNSKNMTQMQLWSRHTTSDSWVTMTSPADVSVTRSITLDVVHFSEWTATDGESPLPVRLLNFNGARITNNEIELRWITTLEKDNLGFEIQKSQDGINFTSSGFVEGKGNSTEKTSYNFIDHKASEAVYYRLRQMDWDGNITISAIVYIPGSKETTGFSIYPNPVLNKITISDSDDQFEQQNLFLEVISDQGITVFTLTGSVGYLNRALNEELETLEPRVYVIHLRCSAQNHWGKFIKR